ncbi:uncharacterized protein ACRADG_007206, partial [Cochliomyia hominivorax]
MELRFMTSNSNSNNTSNNINGNNSSSSNNSCHNSSEKLNSDLDSTAASSYHLQQQPPQRSTSSCETLEASEGVTFNNVLDMNSPLSKPLPPLPTKNTIKLANHTTTSANCGKAQQNTNHKSLSTNNSLNN